MSSTSTSDPRAASKAAWDAAHPENKRARQKKYNTIRRPLKRLRLRIQHKIERSYELARLLGYTEDGASND